MDLVPEASSASPRARKRYLRRTFTGALLFLLLYLGSRVAESNGASHPLVLILGYGGVFALLWMLYEFVHLVRQLDELQQSIHILALALGFGTVATLLTIVGMSLQLWKIEALPDNLIANIGTLAMPIGIVAYSVAVHLVKRRYE